MRILPGRLLRMVVIGIAILHCDHAATAQWSTPPASADTTDPVQPLGSSEAVKGSVQWLVDVALRYLPPTIDGDKGWGDTKRVWAGVRMRFDDGKLKTKRRWRENNHGRWIKYQLDLPTPGDRQQVEIKVNDAKLIEDAGIQKLSIDCDVVAPMQFTARIQRWNRGVRIYSVTASGHFQVRLQSLLAITVTPDWGELPPAIEITPVVKAATMKLERFELDRVSRIGGDVAEAWGEILQETLIEGFINHYNQGKLTEKLNRSITKKQDKFKLSLTDWVNRLTVLSESSQGKESR